MKPATEPDTLELHHLAALLRMRQWQSASNPFNAPAEHPGVLTDLFDAELIDRDSRHALVLTPKGEQAAQEALAAFVRAAA